MLKELCTVSDIIQGADDPILDEVAKKFDVPKEELVWERLWLVHDGNRTKMYHCPNKFDTIPEGA